MKKVLLEQEQALASLRDSFHKFKAEVKNVKQPYKNRFLPWKEQYGKELAQLLTAGIPLRSIVDAVGTSKEIIASAISEAGYPHLLTASVKHEIGLVPETAWRENQRNIMVGRLKDAYDIAKKKGEKGVEKWCQRNRRRLKKLLKIFKNHEELARLIGCDPAVLAVCGKKEITKERRKTSVSTLKEIKKAYKEAGRSKKNLLAWQKTFGEAIAEMLRNRKNFYKIKASIGCSRELVGRAVRMAGHDELLPVSVKTILDKATFKKIKESVLVPTEPEKFGSEFWQSLITTGQAGDVMKEALLSLFNEIAALKSELVNARQEAKKAREEREKAKKEAEDCRKKASMAGIEKDKALAFAASRTFSD